ncbi:putative ATP-grasp-modified RiPP [Streptomyces sparsogenes]|uniref:putative ATP-grasp-modified RiPP n=1 Tax=Streptomyces sparsogenes TaxID=67365 RepID=UPI0009A012AF|nr:putative ATP-grasp-modified RiPP [Streptomyces sparsogenes]
MTLTMDRAQTRPAVRPFGLSKAVPVADEKLIPPTLRLCPKRQISVAEGGTPFISEPSMKSQFETTSQTREDSQLADDKDNDTD